MSLENGSYALLIIIFIILFIVFYSKSEKNFFNFIKDHFFFNRSKTYRMSYILKILSFILIFLSLLDLRGKEETVNAKLSKQKTIILLDTSASMLAEDVRPNRFKKSILLARHFVKNAYGTEISLMVFSDDVKRIIPFTEDYDLLDARLMAIESMNLGKGGSNLSQAIAEATRYFIEGDKESFGNLLVFTDAEETESFDNLKVSDSISVAMIGVGTSKGAPIPLRDPSGNLIGNKKFNGETVISKLGEDFLKSLESKIKHYKFYVATSYSLPTKELLDFFNEEQLEKETDGVFRIKPVLSQYILIPGLVFLILSELFKLKRVFYFFLLTTLFSNVAFSQSEKSEKVLELEDKFKNGKISLAEKKQLAEEYYKGQFYQESKKLYEEILDSTINDKNVDNYLNYFSASLKGGGLTDSLKLAESIKNYAEKNKRQDIVDKINKNIVLSLNDQNNNNDKKENKKDKKDQNNKKNNQDSKNSENNQNREQDKKEENENKESKDNKENKNENDQKDKEKDNGEKNKDENNKPPSKEKLPSLLKQLVDDDNKLQKKLIDGKTEKKEKGKKDW